MSERKNILALYDCRIKQEYIYRTNRVKEIMGASQMLTDLFKDFFNNKNNGFKIRTDWEKSIAPENYLDVFNDSDWDGEIIYEGGGNLCIIYKDYETYISVNKKLSREILEKTFGVSMIASYTEVEKVNGKEDFVSDRRKLYIENALQKNLGSYHTPCNVLPFTQVDRLTHQPIVQKKNKYGKEEQYTTESLRKSEAYEKMADNEYDIIETEFDKMVDKGNDSLLAIIYIDGNNMGKKIKDITKDAVDYASGINALRKFSVTTNEDFVVKPISKIKNRLYELYKANEDDERERKKYLFRPIINGGDEINIVCNAHAVPEILETYFKTLTSESSNSSCAGVAIFHSHAPFADVYRISEQCCESGKDISHIEGNGDNNYIDFHFCHSGITNELGEIRKVQAGKYIGRPYEYNTTWKDFIRYGNMLSSIKRADVKALGEAIIKGDSYYKFELERIKSRDKDKKLAEIYEKSDEVKNYIFDISIVYDLWFADKEQKK